MKIKTEQLQKAANSTARKRGYGRATEVLFSPTVKRPFVQKHIAYGYRKYTTGEYVLNAYLTNFGWKNTYYQHAETTVIMPLNIIDWE